MAHAFLFRPTHHFSLMLATFFSCCGLRHRPRTQPDDCTPLIPHADDTPTRVSPPPPVLRSPPPSPQPRVIDHQKLKDRLGSVVRSKEGKMVNVHAQFPFNLHDHDPEHSSSRSSRNVSGGTLPSSRAASPSPHRQLHKSRSNTFRPDGEDAPHYLPLLVNSSAPVLNVRLVKPARPELGPRGRSQRSDDPSSRTSQSESAPDEEQTPRACPPTSHLQQATHPPVDSELSPHHPEDFNLHDAGAVARSWGD